MGRKHQVVIVRGTGMDSLMKLMRDNPRQYSCTAVWFNDWHHQKEEHLLAAPLETIRKQAVPRLWHRDGVPRSMGLALLAIVLAAGTSCASKQPATETLPTANVRHGTLNRSLQRELAERYLREVKTRLQAEIERRYVGLQVEIYRRSENHIERLASQSQEQLDKAQEDPVARLTEQLNKQQRLRAISQGQRDKELELAAQLSAMLAVSGNENAQLARRVRRIRAGEREAAFTELNGAVNSVLADPRVNFDPAEEARKLLAEHAKDSKNFDDSVNSGLEQLRRYVQSPRNGRKVFATDLVSKDIVKQLDAVDGSGLGSKLVDRAEELLDHAREFADSRVDEEFRKAVAKIAEI